MAMVKIISKVAIIVVAVRANGSWVLKAMLDVGMMVVMWQRKRGMWMWLQIKEYLLMSIFDEKANDRKNPTIGECERTRKMKEVKIK